MTGQVQARRARRTKGHESISRDMLQEKGLTVKARGILAILESLPDEWDVNGVQGFVDQFCGRDGYHAINEGIKELETFGYFARLKRQGDGGRWLWLWSYSDDPADVDEAVAGWERLGYKVATPRGGNRKAVTPAERARGVTCSPRPAARGKRAAQTVSEESEHGPLAVSGKPEHGPSEPVLGKSVHGSSAHGEVPNKEIHSREIPPSPPHSGGDAGDLPGATPAAVAADSPPAEAACAAHGRVRCRPCGHSPRVKAQREREVTAARILAAEDAGRACSMCRADGQRSDGLGSRWQRVHPDGTPVTPWAACDHVTALGVVLAEVAERDDALEAARVQAGTVGPRPPGEAARRVALAAAVPRRLRVDAAVSQPAAGGGGGGSGRR